MTEAMLGINEPLLSIGSQTTKGNPVVVMALPVFDTTFNAPIEAILSFYSNKSINGSFEKKPHIVLSIYQRAYEAQDGYDGWFDIVKGQLKTEDFSTLTMKREAICR